MNTHSSWFCMLCNNWSGFWLSSKLFVLTLHVAPALSFESTFLFVLFFSICLWVRAKLMVWGFTSLCLYKSLTDKYVWAQRTTTSCQVNVYRCWLFIAGRNILVQQNQKFLKVQPGKSKTILSGVQQQPNGKIRTLIRLISVWGDEIQHWEPSESIMHISSFLA